MLHVLTLSTLFPDPVRSGFGLFVGHQTRHLATHPDADVTVIAPIGRPPPPIDRLTAHRALRPIPIVEDQGGLMVYRPRFVVVPGPGHRFTPRAMARAVLPLARRLHAARPFDVIDAEFFWPDGPAAALVGAALGIPWSIKARGSDIHHWGHVPFARAKMVDAARRAGGLLAVSEAMRADMVAIGMPAERITVHYTGVDQSRFGGIDRMAARDRLGIAADSRLILSVGTLNANKGQHLVIDALASLPGWHYAIAGKGPDEAALAARIAAAGLSDRVRLLGALPQDQLPDWYAAADVMALPSAHEGLANAWVESLAAGTPILITDAGGAREVVTGPDAGRIVDRDPIAIATGIAEIAAASIPEDRVRRAAVPFSWERNRDALFDHLSAIAVAARGNPLRV